MGYSPSMNWNQRGITINGDKARITETELVELSQESLEQRLAGGKNRKYELAGFPSRLRPVMTD